MERPLRNALTKYIPIVVGYAGGDHTLMSLFEEIELGGIYWCHLGEPSDKIKRLVAAKNGYLVKVLGFDEVMLQIGECFPDDVKVNDPCPYMREQAEKRCELYQKSLQEIKSKYEMKKSTSNKAPSFEGSKDGALLDLSMQ